MYCGPGLSPEKGHYIRILWVIISILGELRVMCPLANRFSPENEILTSPA